MLKSTEAAEHPLDSEGVWCQILRHPVAGRPALFVDRDGAVVEDTGYLSRVDDVVLIPGAAQVIAAANQHSVAVIMVTNQSGIGRGYYGWAEFKSVQDAIIASLAAEGARIDAVYACAHHPQAEDLLAIPTIRRASPIPACCCRPPPTSRSISICRGSSAIKRVTSKLPSEQALPVLSKSRPVRGPLSVYRPRNWRAQHSKSASANRSRTP